MLRLNCLNPPPLGKGYQHELPALAEASTFTNGTATFPPGASQPPLGNTACEQTSPAQHIISEYTRTNSATLTNRSDFSTERGQLDHNHTQTHTHTHTHTYTQTHEFNCRVATRCTSRESGASPGSDTTHTHAHTHAHAHTQVRRRNRDVARREAPGVPVAATSDQGCGAVFTLTPHIHN